MGIPEECHVLPNIKWVNGNPHCNFKHIAVKLDPATSPGDDAGTTRQGPILGCKGDPVMELIARTLAISAAQAVFVPRREPRPPRPAAWVLIWIAKG